VCFNQCKNTHHRYETHLCTYVETRTRSSEGHWETTRSGALFNSPTPKTYDARIDHQKLLGIIHECGHYLISFFCLLNSTTLIRECLWGSSFEGWKEWIGSGMWGSMDRPCPVGSKEARKCLSFTGGRSLASIFLAFSRYCIHNPHSDSNYRYSPSGTRKNAQVKI
jgi:hypothetical protein